MKIGDLVMTNMWFASHKEWNENRIGLIVDNLDVDDYVSAVSKGAQFEIMWLDSGRLQWLGATTLNSGGTHGVSTEVIS